MTQDFQKARSRRRRGESFWRRTLMAQENSGLSQQEFCRRNDLSLSTFCSWRRRLRIEPDEEADVAVGEFVEIQPAAVDREGVSDRFELIFPGGLRLKLPSRVEGRELAEVLWALEVAGPC